MRLSAALSSAHPGQAGYTTGMHHLLYRTTVSVAASCLVASAISAILCSRVGISIRKGRLRLLAYCLLGSGLTIAGVAMIDGTVEGHFNRTDSWPAYIWVILGVLFAYDGFQRHRRDPEGSEEPYNRNTIKGTGVDTASLLQLSNERRIDHN
jgi:hypothetical protein